MSNTTSLQAYDEEPRTVGPSRRIRVLKSLIDHKWIGIGVFLLILSAGVPVAWMKGKSIFHAEGVVQVSPRFLPNLRDDKELELQSNSQYRQFVQHQVRTINRYDIVADALNRLGDDRYLWQIEDESERRATERLQAALSIRAVPDTYLITVALQGSEAEGLDRIVNTVIEAYLDVSKREEFYGKEERIQNLEDEMDSVLLLIPPLNEQKTQIAQKIGVTTFNANFLNPYDQLLIAAKEAFASARRQRIKAESELYAFDPARNPEGSAALRATAEEMAARDAGLNSLKSNLNLRRTDLLQKVSGLSENHKGRLAVKRELEEIEAEIDQASSNLVSEISRNLLETRRAAYYEARRIESELASDVERQTDLASDFARAYQEALALDLELERHRKQLNSLEDRVEFIELEATAPGFVRSVAAARPPEIPIQGGKKKLLALVLVAAFGLALAAPVAFDFVDPRIRVPADLEKILGAPLLGWVVEKKDSISSEVAVDQMRRISAAVEREHNKNGSQLFALTSPESGSGNTDLATAIARDLVQLGFRPLVFEINFTDPSPVYQNGKRPLVECLETGASFSHAILPGNGESAERVSFGRIRPQDRLRFIKELRGRIAELFQPYDMVLFDTAPLIDTAEVELLLERADVTLLVVKAGTFNRDRIRRTASKLERLGSSVVAFVLNRVNPSDLA